MLLQDPLRITKSPPALGRSESGVEPDGRKPKYPASQRFPSVQALRLVRRFRRTPNLHRFNPHEIPCFDF